MKKTLALLGAGALGFAAGGIGALPAHADATEPCESMLDHVTNETDPGNWYMECIPQYGLGKTEFTIVPDLADPSVEFPDDFVDLLDEDVAESTSLDMGAIAEYLTGGPTPPFPAPITPLLGSGDLTPPAQAYLAFVIAPVTSVAAVAPDNTSEAQFAAIAELCAFPDVPTYQGGWVATYGPTDTTFSQTLDGEVWSWVVEGTPKPTYFFATLDAGGVDTTEDWCITDGVGALNQDDSLTFLGTPLPEDVVDQLFGLVFHGYPNLDEEVFPTLGTFGRFQAAPPAPALAATGAGDPLAPMIAGGILALLGTGLVGLTGLLRRRKQA